MVCPYYSIPIIQDYGQQWLNSCLGTVEILIEARDAAGEFVEENVKAASEKFKQATSSKAA